MPRKTICLNMIVKNEAHLIAETLAHLLTYITFDYWVISDTGSTDATKDIIIDFFKSHNIPGELVEHAWQDFGYNRSKAFEAAYNKTDYAFVWDADDEISGPFKMPAVLTADSYMFTFGNSDGFRYSRHQLFNNRKRWCYRGVLHEYAACLEPAGPSMTVSGDYYFVSGRRGDRSKDPNKYLKDALILEKAAEKALTEKDPLYNRYIFYCAQSYASCNMHEKAIEFYKKALTIEMWVQEKYVSCIEIYEQYEHMGKPIEGLPYLIESYKYDKDRVECIYRLIKFYCINGQIEVSYMYYSLIQDFYENRYDGSKIGEKLFAKKAEYDFYLPYYMIITAEKAKKLETAVKMYEAIVKHGFIVGEWWIRNLVFNIQFCFSALPKTTDFFYKFMDYIKKARASRVTFEPVHLTIISRLIDMYRPILTVADIRPYGGLTSLVKPVKIMMSFTTCKRLDLFTQTINSILNSWTDLDKVDYFFCVDDNSSQRDRTKMRTMCPFMDFQMKRKGEKGHRVSMNIIYDKLKELQPTYWIHMEDDWVFFERNTYVQKSIDFLERHEAKGIHQILYNRNYAETYDGWDINGGEPLDKGFLLHVKSDKIPGRNCAYWPHYSFRPSMIRVSTIMELGNYDSPNTFFERDYADKYFAKGYKSAFYDTVCSLHIGKLTSDKSGENAYTMNGVGQFGDMDKKSPNAFVVNLLRRTDRKEAVETAFDAASIKEYEFIEAVDGKELVVTDEINTLFAGNDFGSRKGVIGCALSHYGLWKQLAADTSNEYYTIFEDDIQLVDGFKEGWIEAATLSSSDADMIFLGYHVRDVHKAEVKKSHENNLRPLDSNIYIGGFFAYIITKKGSQKMLDYIATNGIKHGIDYLVKVVPGFKSYNCQPHIVLSDWVTSSASPVDTDIQKDYSSLQIVPKINTDEWKFYEGVDSSDGDIRCVGKLSVTEIMKAASAESKCVAFNTLGFLKISVTELKATPYISAPGTGIYIRKPSSKYLISSYLCGGLGNRLFQISAALGLAEITGQKVVFYSNQVNSISHQDINNIYKMFPDIQVLNDAGDVDSFYEEKNKHFTFKAFPPTKKNTVIHGYRQSPLYLPSTGVHPVLESEDLYLKYGLDTDESRLNSWFIHIRLGDYKTNGCVNHITVETYHKYILHNIPDEANVILFSDEPIAAENQLKKYFNHEIRVCSETDEVKCLGLMSQCWGGAIVPNSTFSWWGAYLAYQASSCPDSFKAYFPTKWNTEIPGSIKNHCIPSWGIGIDPIEKEKPAKTYTIAGRTDGFGGQYQGIMSGIAICEYKKYKYIHAPLINVEGSSDVDALNKLIGIPSSNPEIPIIREVFSNEVHYSKTPSIYYTPSVISKIREWYYMTEKPMIEPVDIAIHIRRGNVNSKVHSDRYTSNETYANIIKALKIKYPLYKIHVFSEGSIDDFIGLEADSFRLNEDICATFHSMVCAKVLVTARSSLSYSAAILNANTVYYHDFWHAPLDNWLQLTSLNMSLADEWTFYEGLDSGGSDIRRGDKDISRLKAAASADPSCVAFNTLGFLKSYVKFPLLKSPYIHAPGGLYVKKSYKPTTRVKMLCNWCSSEDLCKEWLKMSKGSYKWNNLEITWSDHNIDYYVIINKPQPGAKFVPEKTIIFHMEPWCDSPQQNWGVKTWGEWAKPDPSKFLQIRSHDKFLNPGFWQINLTYSQLKEMDMVKYKYEDKANIVSSICSSKYFDPGHKKRIDFLKFVEAKGGVKLHIYNEDNQHAFKSYQGTARPSVDKEKGLVPYKYYFMCENNVEANFITEKLWEPILCEALCFYWGCPNVAEHVDPMAYVQLNMDDFEASYNIMNAAIETNLWEERLPYIKKAKQRILDEQGFFPMLEKALKPKAVCFIHSCHLAAAGTNVLNTILKGAMDINELEAIIINNIGLPLDSKYMSLDPRIKVIQCSSDPGLFELPTLRLVHEFSLNSPNTKILYMHTKGVSYSKTDYRYINGFDWTLCMVYFLCSTSGDCIKLLESYDAAGCNSTDNPKPHFSGNFWWANSSYLKNLDTGLLTDKMSAEMWLLSKPEVKRVTLWQSGKNHYYERYYNEQYTRFGCNYTQIEFISICHPNGGPGLCNQLMSLISGILWGIDNNKRLIAVNNFSLDINSRAKVSSSEVFDFELMNTFLTKYNIKLIDASHINNNMPFNYRFNWINTNVKDKFQEFTKYIKFNKKYYDLASNVISSVGSSFNTIHIRTEEDAITHWSKQNNMSKEEFKCKLESIYINYINLYFDKSIPVLILTYDTTSVIIKYLADNGYIYKYLDKLLEGRENNAIIDLICASYTKGIFIGNFNETLLRGSSFSYSILQLTNNYKRYISVDLDNIF